MTPKAVSVIVPTWNTCTDILEFLESVAVQSYPRKMIDVVIVDNGSSDDTVVRLTQWVGSAGKVEWNGLKLIKNQRNRGIAAAYNQGLAHANKDSEIIIRAESDVLWNINVVTEIVRAFEEESSAGIVGAKGIWVTDVTRIDHAARGMNWWTGRLSALPLEGRTQCDCVFGGTLGVRRSVLNKIGEFFCGNCFLASELELCTRVKAQGYLVVCEPRAVAKHKIAHSTRQIDQERMSYIDARESVRFQIRYNRGLARISSIGLLFAQHVKRAIKGNAFPLAGMRDAVVKEMLGRELFGPMQAIDLHAETAAWVAGGNDE